MTCKFSLVIASIALSIAMIATTTSYAGSSRSYLTVSCSVVKSAGVSFTPISTALNTNTIINGNTAQVGGITVSCPKGVPISISYNTSTDCSGKYKGNGANNPPDIKFYKDASCTEVWKASEQESFCSFDKNKSVTKSVYCKTNSKDIKLEKGQSAVIFSVSVDY